MNMMNRLRLGPIVNSLDLVLHDLHGFVFNDMSTEFNFLLIEDAFHWVCKEFVPCKYLKYLLQMIQMLLIGVEENSDIIEVNDYKFIKEGTKDSIDKCLKCCQ